MYDFLEGTVAELGAGQVVLAVGGIGFALQITPSCQAGLELNQIVKLRVHHSVSEHAQSLFGFASILERSLFRRLLQVNGIGPQSALTLLGSLPPEDMMRAILDADTAALIKLKGVGKKTAERLVVELRDHLEDLLPGAPGATRSSSTSPDSGPEADLVQVLCELGHSPADAARKASQTLDALGAETDFQDLLRHALRPSS